MSSTSPAASDGPGSTSGSSRSALPASPGIKTSTSSASSPVPSVVPSPAALELGPGSTTGSSLSSLPASSGNTGAPSNAPPPVSCVKSSLASPVASDGPGSTGGSSRFL